MAARRTRTVAPMARLAKPVGAKDVLDTPLMRPLSTQYATASLAQEAMLSASSKASSASAAAEPQ